VHPIVQFFSLSSVSGGKKWRAGALFSIRSKYFRVLWISRQLHFGMTDSLKQYRSFSFWLEQVTSGLSFAICNESQE
jgi:hypothetical protein